MITEFKLFENIADVPKVGDYYIMLYNYVSAREPFTAEFKAKILEIESVYYPPAYHCLFLDNQNKFHKNSGYQTVTPKELIRKMTPEEIKDFEYQLDVKKKL